MIEARVYRGIEFIRISELPEDQKSLIEEWAIEGTIIKILTDKTLLTDCIQFKDYKYWFENVFSKAVQLEEKPEYNRKRTVPIKLAIGR